MADADPLTPSRTSALRGAWPPRVAALAVLAVLLVATAVASVVSARVIAERRDATRERRAASAVDAIDRRIAAYTEILYGARSLSALGPLTPARYHAYIERLHIDRRYPGIQVTTFATAVPAAGLAAFRRDLAADVRRSRLPYPPFRLTPPGTRRDHVVIGMLEPQRGNERAFGFDLLAEPTRRAAVEQARDTGGAAATGPITLIQETGRQRGLIIMLPVYRPQAPIATVPERRRAFVGVQTAAFRVGDLMHGVLGARGEGGHLEIFDQGAVRATPTTALRATDRFYARGPEGAGHPHAASVRVLEVAGRRWAVRYHDAPSAITGAEDAIPWAVAAAGTAISALAAWLVLLLTGSRARAVRLAERMTRELRAREGTLHQRAQELERSNRDLAQFASVASHDLKTPLRSVKGYVDLLARRYRGRLDADADEFLAFASDGTVRMEALIDDLLAYAAVGSTPADCAPVDLDAVARQAVLALRRQIREAGAEVRLDGLPTVPGDERQLGQLIGNLLTNALKFTDAARSPVIAVTADRVDDAWRIDVTDNGIGVADHDAERIFAMFGRLHSADAFPGTGIGLAICKRIVENHGGTLDLRPSTGPGAVFSFTLPVGVAGGVPVSARG